MGYDKWKNVGDRVSEETEADENVTLPPEVARAFMDVLCERVMVHLAGPDGLQICCSVLQRAFPSSGCNLEEQDLTSKVVTVNLIFPKCVPKRWRGRELTRLAGQAGAIQCVSEILEDLSLGVMARDAFFVACGNAPGSEGHRQLSERLNLRPGHFLLAAQLATPDACWVDTRELAWSTPSVSRAPVDGPTERYESSARRVCAGCQQREPAYGKYHVCSRCRKQHYCSAECQKRAWKAGHKGECTQG